MNENNSQWEIKILVIISIIVIIAFSQPIFFPLILSFFLYLLLDPLLEWMVKIKLPKILASSLIVIGLLGIVSSGITLLVQPASNWIQNAPENFRTIEKKFTFIKKSLGKINQAAETAQELTKTKKNVTIVAQNTNIGSSLFGLTSNLLILIFTVLIFLFFLLNYFKEFIQQLERIHNNRKRKVTENAFLLSLKSEVSKYLFIFSMICVGLGTAVGFIFTLLGMPNPMLWGVMAMLLTFIPYLGHLIGIVIIAFVSLITFDSYFHILTPPIMYLLVATLEGQFITPIFLGNRLNLNPLVVFFSMFIWERLWGISGIIISVPLLITIKITLAHVRALSRYEQLLEQ